jgi:uncharacterized membrane protein
VLNTSLTYLALQFMLLKKSNPFWQVVGLGVLAGMRTFAAPVVASHILSKRHSYNLSSSPLKFMQSANTAIAFKVLACGELIGDKLPDAPNRIEAGGLIGRCLSGSLAGASIYKASGRSAITGALFGSVAALGATFASYYLRRAAVKENIIHEPMAGVAEDALVVATGVSFILIS